jgi:hypothetical protein
MLKSFGNLASIAESHPRNAKRRRMGAVLFTQPAAPSDGRAGLLCRASRAPTRQKIEAAHSRRRLRTFGLNRFPVRRLCRTHNGWRVIAAQVGRAVALRRRLHPHRAHYPLRAVRLDAPKVVVDALAQQRCANLKAEPVEGFAVSGGRRRMGRGLADLEHGLVDGAFALRWYVAVVR